MVPLASRIVDGIAGERAVYKRRAEVPPQPGAPQTKPKLLRFVIDCSGSMYYFNNYDARLERTLQTAVMIFEAFAGFEHKYRYSLVGHSGDTPCAPLVEYGMPPPNEKERLKVVQRMVRGRRARARAAGPGAPLTVRSGVHH